MGGHHLRRQRTRDDRHGPDGLIYVLTEEDDGAVIRIERRLGTVENSSACASLRGGLVSVLEALFNNLLKFNQGFPRKSDRLTLLACNSSLRGTICVNLEKHLGRVVTNYGVGALGFSVLRIAFESLLRKVSNNRHDPTLTQCHGIISPPPTKWSNERR